MVRSRMAVLALLCGCVLLCCTMSIAPTFKQALSEPDANFTLIVSNQSFAKPRVDIRVSIDGKAVVADRFEVKNQHYWTSYSIFLAEGEHVLHAEAAEGAVFLDTSFEITRIHRVLLSYFVRDNGEGKGPRLEFRFHVYDKPILFG